MARCASTLSTDGFSTSSPTVQATLCAVHNWSTPACGSTSSRWIGQRRFPYDDGQEDPDFHVIADDLRADLVPIDRPAWYGDGYWDTFYWDVTIGDYHSILFGRPEP